jgi:hypothetical protein
MWVRSWCQKKKKKNSCALLGSYNICGRQFVGISFFILFNKKKNSWYIGQIWKSDDEHKISFDDQLSGKTG